MCLFMGHRDGPTRVDRCASVGGRHRDDDGGRAVERAPAGPMRVDFTTHAVHESIMALATIGKPMTFTVRAARHANKKATKGHRDTRPKKSSPSQRKRTPTEYPKVDPASVPAVMTVVSK